MNQITGNTFKVLRVHLQVFNWRKEVIAYDHAYTTPSASYIARRTGLSRSAVARSNSALVRLKLLTRRQLRDKHGEWKTNLYKLGAHFDALWQAFKEKVKGSKNAGLHKAANIENKEALEDNYFAHFQQFLRNLGGRGQQPGFT